MYSTMVTAVTPGLMDLATVVRNDYFQPQQQWYRRGVLSPAGSSKLTWLLFPDSRDVASQACNLSVIPHPQLVMPAAARTLRCALYLRSRLVFVW